METDIVIVDTEETNALIRDIMETDILAEENKHKVFNMYSTHALWRGYFYNVIINNKNIKFE